MFKKRLTVLAICLVGVGLAGCAPAEDPAIARPEPEVDCCEYLDVRTPGDYQAGGVRFIELEEGYRVWTKRFGNSPRGVARLPQT